VSINEIAYTAVSKLRYLNSVMEVRVSPLQNFCETMLDMTKKIEEGNDLLHY
jgi:hypothetical protein